MIRFLTALALMSTLGACVTSDGKPYDFGKRLGEASKELRDKPQVPTVIIVEPR